MYQISPHPEVCCHTASICTLARANTASGTRAGHVGALKLQGNYCFSLRAVHVARAARHLSVPKSTTPLEAKQSIHTRHCEETFSLQNTNEALETNNRLKGAHIPDRGQISVPNPNVWWQEDNKPLLLPVPLLVTMRRSPAHADNHKINSSHINHTQRKVGGPDTGASFLLQQAQYWPQRPFFRRMRKTRLFTGYKNQAIY